MTADTSTAPIAPHTSFRWKDVRFPGPIITWRGFILAVFSAYLLIGPGLSEDDILATVIAAALISGVVIITTISFIHGIALRRHFKIISGGASPNYQEIIVSETPTTVTMRTSQLNLLPFFNVKVSMVFEHEALKPGEHIITGRSEKQRILQEQLIFPHRGVWQVHHLLVSFQDMLGITRYSWKEEEAGGRFAFTVHPPREHMQKLPIVTSCRRAGDLYVDLHNRLGDPFDIKRYHPSDSMNKILWKIFAKRGELLSRHPEASMTPEGQSILFSAAGRTDDRVCTACLSYLKQLTESDIITFVSCEGAEGRSIAHDEQDAEELMIDTVWNLDNKQRSLVEDLERLLDQVQDSSQDISLENALIFLASDSIESKEHLQAIIQAGDMLSKQGLNPVFFDTNIEPQTFKRKTEKKHSSGRLKSLLLENKEGEDRNLGNFKRAFLTSCAARNWEIISVA